MLDNSSSQTMGTAKNIYFLGQWFTLLTYTRAVFFFMTSCFTSDLLALIHSKPLTWNKYEYGECKRNYIGCYVYICSDQITQSTESSNLE